MSSTASPTRRVLGEKDANASLSVLSPRTTSKPQTDPSTLLSPLGRINVTQGRLQPPASSPRAGQKRRISEVEGAESEDGRHDISASQQTVAISDTSFESVSGKRSSGTTRTSMSGVDTSMTSLSASQQDEDAMDIQFELPAEEMSQKSLEKMHEVSLPQNSSQPEVEQPKPGLRTEVSQLSSGMSSFIDFGGSDPSQQSEDHQAASADVQQDNTDPDPALTEEEERKALMSKKAAELRTRLQFAYFKVQTNQTTTPFSRLKVPESMKKTSSPTLKQYSPVPPRNSNTPMLPLPPTQRFGAAEVSLLEERISAARARATSQPKPAVHALNDLPVPKIIPHTRVHQTTTNHTHSSAETHQDQEPDIPSSPPLSRSSADPDDETNRVTRPSRNKISSQSYTADKAEQLSSPPPSHDGSDEDNQQTPRASPRKPQDPNSLSTKNTPSSAIKGEVADSLLQLMRGVSNGKGMCGL